MTEFSFENSTLSYSNTTSILTKCDFQPQNPWCGKYGVEWTIEIIFYALLIVGGILGNVTVILSIILDNKTHKNGNIFIINLAFADFIVCGIYAPTNLASIIKTEQALSDTFCHVMGYVIVVTCLCSMCNLAFIALNRYWAVIRRLSYKKHFSKKRTVLMILFSWSWSILLTSPTLLGWGGVTFDHYMMACTLDDSKALSYTILSLLLGVVLPLVATVMCYWRLYRYVRRKGKKLQRRSSPHHIKGKKKASSSLRREISLLRTLATAVIAFVICWTPYGICILLTNAILPHQIKKAAGIMCISNSGLNFIIYGFMNNSFRRGYIKLFRRVFCHHLTKTKRMGSSDENSPAIQSSFRSPIPSSSFRR